MKPGEHAELERQGAKAAARGEAWGSNPMLRALNMPPLTGESQQEWQRRYDAWRVGYERQASRPVTGVWIRPSR
ncbi:CrpP-related protein [Azohydromonas aeria]|uniref:CrpP-related protein n=1 Tax=Azohydromonas aeria TaxID=2590212 RepID=UPI0012FC247E|nr:CrpP-related protein [Azohydromonas aeria]